MKVFLNPGHDLYLDPGACGNGLEESQITCSVAKLLEGYLERAGIQVVHVMQDDDLEYVCYTANQSDADIFVSIHCNAAENIEAHGTETFAYALKGPGAALAIDVQTSIVSALGTNDRGIKQANFLVLKQTIMPAILVELAFISNKDDAELLKTKQEEFALAIAKGIEDYALKQSKS